MVWIHEPSRHGSHSCFYSVRDVVVVVLPSFTSALFRGNPFHYPNPSSPSPVISSAHSKENCSLTHKHRSVGDNVCRGCAPLQKCVDRVLGILLRQIKLSLEVYINTYYNDKASWQPDMGRVTPIINTFFVCVWDHLSTHQLPQIIFHGDKKWLCCNSFVFHN